MDFVFSLCEKKYATKRRRMIDQNASSNPVHGVTFWDAIRAYAKEATKEYVHAVMSTVQINTIACASERRNGTYHRKYSFFS